MSRMISFVLSGLAAIARLVGDNEGAVTEAVELFLSLRSERHAGVAHRQRRARLHRSQAGSDRVGASPAHGERRVRTDLVNAAHRRDGTHVARQPARLKGRPRLSYRPMTSFPRPATRDRFVSRTGGRRTSGLATFRSCGSDATPSQTTQRVRERSFLRQGRVYLLRACARQSRGGASPARRGEAAVPRASSETTAAVRAGAFSSSARTRRALLHSLAPATGHTRRPVLPVLAPALSPKRSCVSAVCQIWKRSSAGIKLGRHRARSAARSRPHCGNHRADSRGCQRRRQPWTTNGKLARP